MADAVLPEQLIDWLQEALTLFEPAWKNSDVYVISTDITAKGVLEIELSNSETWTVDVKRKQVGITTGEDEYG